VRFMRAVAVEVVNLFVGDWAQTFISLAILAAGWFLLNRFHAEGLGFVIVLALALQLIYETRRESMSGAARRSGS
jgi:hypothetical protein